MAVVIGGVCLIAGLSIWRLMPDVAHQIDQLVEILPRPVERLEYNLQQYSWGRQLLKQMPSGEEMPDGANALVAKAAKFFRCSSSVC